MLKVSIFFVKKLIAFINNSDKDIKGITGLTIERNIKNLQRRAEI
jgi:hypothetical protein